MATILTAGTWTLVATLTPPPTGVQMRMDQAFTTPNLVTKIWVRPTDANGQDLRVALREMVVGATTVVRDTDDATRSATFTVASATIDNASYFEIPVTWVSSGVGALRNHDVNLYFESGVPEPTHDTLAEIIPALGWHVVFNFASPIGPKSFALAAWGKFVTPFPERYAYLRGLLPEYTQIPSGPPLVYRGEFVEVPPGVEYLYSTNPKTEHF